MSRDVSPFVGAWQAVAYTMERGTLAVPARQESDPSAVAFLNDGDGASDVRVERAVPEPGQLRLDVGADGQFVQTVDPDNPLYLVDADGCEDRRGEALAFDGRLRRLADSATLVPNADWGVRRTDLATLVGHLRYSDGDTSVSDAVRRSGDTLTRTTRVVTDGSYTTTIAVVYRAAP